MQIALTQREMENIFMFEDIFEPLNQPFQKHILPMDLFISLLFKSIYLESSSIWSWKLAFKPY